MVSHLVARPTQLPDLRECTFVMHDGFMLTEQERCDLLPVWRNLLEEGYVLSGVVEGQTAQGRCIVGFAMNAFVQETFMEQIHHACKPHVSRQLYAQWQAGLPRMLDRQAIARANHSGAGLHLLGLHFGWGRTLPFLSAADHEQIRDLMMGSLFTTYQGYYLKSFAKEVYGEAERERYRRFGCDEWSDGASPLPPCADPLHQPFLMGVTRKQAMSPDRQGSKIRDLFSYTEPVFRFTARQQEFLSLSCLGLTDKQIAQALFIGEEAVDAMWDRICDHVQKIKPEVFGQLEGERGYKKERLRLYLKRFPEELRPRVRSRT